ncbi:MAG: hypothetical protein KFE24_05835 [Wolbachia endosymbiont of Homalodisca vitripennis]|nr:hypothetical protein [Wolbachia endosymbiont of Homalodisca vitripennis]
MLNKENIEKQVTNNQSRLIRMQEDTLLLLQLSEDFEVGEAAGGGDCFFDSVAQGLKQLNPEANFTVKSLREICKKQALSSQKMKKKIIADARNRGDFKVVLPEPGIDDDELWSAYLTTIEYTAEDVTEMETQNLHLYELLTSLKYGSTLQVPIWGRPDIEGRMISSEYNLKLHVIESNLLYATDKQQDPFLHQLASNKMNLSNQEETHQFKFLVVLSIVVKEAPHAVITGIFTGAISARRLACFWRNGQIIDGVLRLPRLASNKMNLSNQEETHQFKFLVVLSIVHPFV